LRLPDRLLLLRGAPGQGLLDRGAGPGRRGARRVRRGPGGTPGRADLRPPGGAARRPRPGVAHRPLAGGHADRPGPPRAAHGAAPRALPAHAAPGLRTGGRPRRRRPPVGAPPRRPRRVRPGVRLRRLGARRTRLRRGAEAGPHRPGGAADQGGLRLMRLHRLTVQAFGPFAGAEEVDFDRLGAAGLFLVHGPTGAGKTSVLDAVCFALYGGVPGVRGAARALQSTHAPPDLRPEVALEFTVRGRRPRITRSPAWRRPKKRGSGTTEEKAKVAVAEHTDGTWRPITLRPDEAGQFVSDLLGVNLKQFCQVVLLPQGEFARFLRAPARERRDSLEQIFGTGVFTDVEKWLAEHSAALGRAAGRAETSVLNTARLLAEVARSPLPEAVEDDLDSLVPWAAELACATAADARDAAPLVTGAAAARDRARTALEQGRSVLERRRRRAAAAAREAELTARAAERAAWDAELAAAERAAPVAPLLRAAGNRRVELEKAELAAAELTSLAGGLADAPAPRPAAAPG